MSPFEWYMLGLQVYSGAPYIVKMVAKQVDLHGGKSINLKLHT